MLKPDKRLLNAWPPGKIVTLLRQLHVEDGLDLAAVERVCLHYRTMAPIGLFAAGVACIAASVFTGEAEVSLFLIFPVFSGSSGLFLLGTLLIILSFIAGFMILTIGQIEIAGGDFGVHGRNADQEDGTSERRYGGVVLVGPVPIAFGSDRKMALAMFVIGIVLAIATLVALALLLG